MAEERRSKLPKHEPGKVPDPSPDCPRCHYWELKAREEAGNGRQMVSAYPGGINQRVADEILAKAFPQRQRS